MLESLQAISLLTIMEIVGPVLLLAVLIYGTMQWSRRRRGPTQAVREASTRQLYRESAEAEKREEAGRRRRNTPKADRSASDILATEPVASKQSPARGTAGL